MLSIVLSVQSFEIALKMVNEINKDYTVKFSIYDKTENVNVIVW